MQFRRRGVEMVERCREMDFSLYEREGGALVEGVESFKYLGRLLDQTDYDWLEIIRNIKQAQKVWGSLRGLLRS